MEQKTIPSIEDTLRHVLGECNIEYYELEESCPEVIKECLSIIRNTVELHIQACKEEIAESTIVDDYDTDGELKPLVISLYPLDKII